MLIAKFLLLVSLGLVGLTIFSLFLGLIMVGEETGDFPLSFLAVWITDGLSPLIVLGLIGFFKLSVLEEGLSFGYIFADLSMTAVSFMDFMLLGSDLSLYFLTIPIFLEAYSCFFEPSALFCDAPDFLSL